MKPLRFAVFGTGFWATYQLAAWREVPGAKCVALCDRIRATDRVELVDDLADVKFRSAHRDTQRLGDRLV